MNLVTLLGPAAKNENSDHRILFKDLTVDGWAGQNVEVG